ncbi:MAG: hypothetical protein Q9167_006383 [Letrouitia subvulpina]
MASHPAQGNKRDFGEVASANKASEETASPNTVVVDSTLPDRCGKRLKSTQFTISVGPDHEIFLVHQAVLDASPVLSRLCSECTDNRLNLPDDDPSQFGLLLEFLYSKDFNFLSDNSSNSKDDTKGTITPALHELCQIYRIGEKYQLPKIQKCVVGKFDKTTDLERDPISFLRVAKELYGTLAESDSIYAPFFVKITENLFQKPTTSASISQYIKKASRFGGKFAEDIVTAQHNACLATQTVSQNRAIQGRGFQNALNELKESHAKIKHSLSQIKQNHDYNHDECERCLMTDI